MNFGRQFATLAFASVLLFGLGCEKKKPQLPAQAKAPAETVATPLPSEISEAMPPPSPPAPTPTPAAQPTVSTPPPKRHTKKKTTTPAPSALSAATPPSSAPGNNTNTTTVAAAHPPPNPAEAAPDPAIAADVTSAQLTRQKQSTAQLLDDTEKSISGLKGLSHDEEETLAQIRSYVSQSRKATSEGDFERAYNLATKAHLLSNALVKK
jgi:hypothetical protein